MVGSRDKFDPQVTHYFSVEIESMVAARFQEISGLSNQTEVLEIKEGGLNCHVHKVAMRTTYGELTLKRGFVDNPLLFGWNQAVALSSWTPRLNGAIVLNKPDDMSGGNFVFSEVSRWNFFRAFPSKWEGPQLNASSSGLAVESMTLVCEWITMAIS